MTCVVCRSAGNCKACRYEGRVRELVDTDPVYRDLIAEMWRASPEPAEYLRKVVAAHHAGHAGPAVAESLEMARRIRSCRHRTPCHTCGLGKAECALGKGRDGTVYPDDCRACLSDSPDP
jgi:ferredoxin